jgi:hypothetical protein
MRPVSFLLTLSIAVPAEAGHLLSYGNEAIWRHLKSGPCDSGPATPVRTSRLLHRRMPLHGAHTT